MVGFFVCFYQLLSVGIIGWAAIENQNTSLTLLHNSKRQASLSPLYRQAHRGWESWDDQSRVLGEVSGRSRIQSQAWVTHPLSRFPPS